MTIRWFGESWGAPVCDPETHVETPAGKRCLGCPDEIEEGQAGVVVLASPEIAGRYVYSVRDPNTNELRSTYVGAYHLQCVLATLGIERRTL